MYTPDCVGKTGTSSKVTRVLYYYAQGKTNQAQPRACSSSVRPSRLHKFTSYQYLNYILSMNLQLTPERKQIIQNLNATGIPYLIREEYRDLISSWGANNENLLFIWVQYPQQPEDISAISKAVLGKVENNFQGYSSYLGIFGLSFCPPQSREDFFSQYQQRVIVNHQGLALNFAKSESVLGDVSTKTEIQLQIDDFLSDIESLNLFAVQYLVVDEYPQQFTSTTLGTNTMILWLGISEENEKRIRKANAFITGNPPKRGEMLKPRKFQQGGIIWQNYYDNLDFEECYQQRDILNIQGITVNFLKRPT